MNKCSDRAHTPIVSEKQRAFFGAEAGRAKEGKKTRSGMTREELKRHLREVRDKRLPKKAKKFIGGDMLETKFSFFVPINKVDVEERMVYGIATTSALDKQNEIVDWGATKEALLDYSNWRNIREMHKPSAVGTAPIIEARDNTQEVYIGAKIVDEQAWQKCKEGVYKGFSIGGDVLNRAVEFSKTAGKTINRVTKYVLNEISVVDRPANPLCRFQTVKRDMSIETITISEDPLKAESARVMEKSISIAKRILSKAELEALPDNKFGLIKIIPDGDKIVKHRMYPIPDNTHAINMIRKMAGCEDLSEIEKVQIHTAAVAVLGKKHVEGECPYCVKTKIEGGAGVKKEEVKKAEGTVVVAEDPKKKPATEVTTAPADSQKTAEAAGAEKGTVVQTQKPAEEQKPHVKVDEEAPVAGSESAAGGSDISSRLDRIENLLAELLGEEGGEQGNGEEPAADDAALNADEDASGKAAEDGDGDGEEEPAKVDAKPAAAAATVEEVAKEEGEEDAACKTVGVNTVKKVSVAAKTNLLKQMKAIVEPMAKEIKDLKTRLEKYEKAPLPRKGATPAAPQGPAQKIEKFDKVAVAKQDMVIEKREIAFSEELQKDISKAETLRKSGKVLNAEDTAFCQRVAEKMLDEKITKVQ